jgi:hypothetical protein
MPARDWAAEEADALMGPHPTVEAACRAVAEALRAAEARGYQRAQDEFKRITDAVWPMVEKDDGGAT